MTTKLADAQRSARESKRTASSSAQMFTHLCESTQAEASKTTHAATAALRAQVAALQKRNASLKAELETTQTDAEAMHIAHSRSATTYQEARLRSGRLVQSYEDQKTANDNMLRQLDAVTREHEPCDAKLSKTVRRVQLLTGEAAGKDEAIAALTRKLDELKATQSKAPKTRERKQKEAADKAAAHSVVVALLEARLQAKVKQLTKELETAQTQIDELSSERQTLWSRVAALDDIKLTKERCDKLEANLLLSKQEANNWQER
jgi:chromosome segregation ATPase